MVRNGTKLYFPVKESILSILPLVDEFVIALGQGDDDDRTREEILSIGSAKIKFIDTVWDKVKYPYSTEFAHQTDIAKEYCSGDWLFYLQSDEVVHEKYLPVIKTACEKYLEDKEVEGLLFNYRHFWGDFDHYLDSHGWYPSEIRIIRNDPAIHSWKDAQSFRKIKDFKGTWEDYCRHKGTRKLKVARSGAEIYHYGWVRPPHVMASKKLVHDTLHHGAEKAENRNKLLPGEFDYGPLNWLPVFKDSHPAVLRDWIRRFDWKGKLQYTGRPKPGRPKYKHEKLGNRILTFIEQKLLRGRHLGSFKNYRIIK